MHAYICLFKNKWLERLVLALAGVPEPEHTWDPSPASTPSWSLSSSSAG